MTNRSSSKQHGLSHVHTQRPKSKTHKRNNKAKARERAEKLQAELKKAAARA